LATTHTLFEVSWEVCNKVGGIHTVVSTKAKTLVDRYRDRYVAIGPWLLGARESAATFEEEAGYEAFAESCRQLGVPVRVGRWKIPGAPRTILVEFSGLFAKKNDILANLWERFAVDSLTGGWDYDEPVLFGHAAALVIERWVMEFVAPADELAVAQFHEWMTGSGLLYLKQKLPALGLVFTTHATMLGRSLSGSGKTPIEGLAGRTPEQAANELGIRSKHSMESVCAREADVFTTVSELTAREAELLLGRKPHPTLPNGIDLSVIDALAGDVQRTDARAKVKDLAHRFLGVPCDDAALLLLSGRYEFHNKGIDLLLESLAQVNAREGKPIVMFLTVPAGQSGVSQAVRNRLEQPLADRAPPLGISTHNLIDPDHDPIQRAASRLGFDNAHERRVKLVQIPIYLHEGDGLLGLPYEAMLRAMDLTAFPSFYEPWGYTPEESLAVGVPTITTDLAGFGLWAREQKLGPDDGVYVLARSGVADADAASELSRLLERFLAEGLDHPETYDVCRRTAQRTAWSDLIQNYYAAFDIAVEAAHTRAGEHPLPRVRPQVALHVAPQPEGRKPRLFPFEVSATLPKELAGLERLSRNYYWCWDPEGTELFEELSPVSWQSCGHNPVLSLRLVYPEDLIEKAAEPAYVQKLERVLARFDAYMGALSTGTASLSDKNPVAYFCAEFGLHESLKVYSGGLGILAGDHLKSASDLRMPLVAVGLFYRNGYLRQKVTSAGDQLALEAGNDPRSLAVELVRNPRGEPLEVVLELPSSQLHLRAWRVRVGRVELYLLDSDVPSNRPEDRVITQQLYGGDHEHRLRQELVLGRGGVRMLGALGIAPSAWHINEGHAAFLVLERTAKLVHDQGLTFDEARELVRATTTFTTHTPVPAGHDRFGEDLMRRYFSDAQGAFGLTWERFLSLGQTEEDKSAFNMTYLALSFAGFANGVSKLHGEVSKELLLSYWPRLLKSEVPIRSITNGVHLASWTHPDIGRLLGAGARAIRGSDFGEHAEKLDMGELWRVRRALRARLIAKARENIERAFVDRQDSPRVLTRILEGLDERALLVGFARRFAPYKRANLIFKDIERLRELLNSTERPLRIFFAGKAHPKDGAGQEILKGIVELTRRDEFLGRVFFLEDYDIELARHLVQGVDVWLNNPIRTLEASGTSGMKVAANAGLNLSVPDGWWVEGYDGSNGWNVGEGRTYPSGALQDELDSASIVRLFADEILPMFFERDEDDVPRRWLERALHNLATIPPVFNTDRMVGEYRDLAYAPMAQSFAELSASQHAPLRKLAAERGRLRRAFGEIKIVEAQLSDVGGLLVGDPIEARVRVDLGSLDARDVRVELVLGHTKGAGDLHQPQPIALAPSGRRDGNVQLFRGAQKLSRSGNFAYGIRVRAVSDGRLDSGLSDLVLWA
jgi:phosphorylase/glycogen(starch) synthase